MAVACWLVSRHAIRMLACQTRHATYETDLEIRVSSKKNVSTKMCDSFQLIIFRKMLSQDQACKMS